MKIRRMIIMLAASAVLFGGVFGFVAFRNSMIKQFFANQPRPVVAVTTAPALLEDWMLVIPAVGTLQAVNGVDVAGSMAGLIKDIAFQSGQEVRRGQMLVRLDSDVELSDLRSAEAELALARTSFDRSAVLQRSNTVSVSALERAESELKVRQARVAALHAQIGKKSITAPFDGVVGLRRVDLGQYLQPGQVIVNLQDLSMMLCDFTVSQKDLPALAVGQGVRMSADAWPGEGFEGTIAAIEPQVDAKTGMVAVQASFANPDRRLRPGMFARVEIERPAAGKVVTVPASAVSYNLHGDSVFVVREVNGTKSVERAVVKLGDRRDGMVVIRQGIKPGDLVVTSGQVKLENGSLVQIAADDPLKLPGKTAAR
jgi:membrane fusion protein (multidrug efflux system)